MSESNLSDITAELLRSVQDFGTHEIEDYRRGVGADHRYPAGLVSGLAALGLFGVNVPEDHNGLGLPPVVGPRIVRAVAARWQSLAALLGTHWRANLYLVQEGTSDQKRDLLPTMASGALQVAHAYHEARNNELEAFQCELRPNGSDYLLSGTKHWVTNAAQAERIIVIARHSGTRDLSAVLVDPSRPGVQIGAEHPRPGMLGISLASVYMADYAVSDEELIGGRQADIRAFIERFEPGSSLGFAARALGSADSLISAVRDDVAATVGQYDAGARGVIQVRIAEMETRYRAMEAFVETALTRSHSDGAIAHMAKIFCSDELVELTQNAVMLSGGAGYTGHGAVRRAMDDATALRLIDTPNDVLLSRVGRRLL